MSVVDLDLIIASHSDGTTAALQLCPADKPATQLAPPTPWALDTGALLALALDPIAYGRVLTAQIFASPDLQIAWHKAIAISQNQDVTLRLRLILPNDAPELHALRWETLHDLTRWKPITTSDRIWLVRLISTPSLTSIRMPPRTGLRATVVISSPRNLARFQLADVDVEGEVGRARRILGSACSAIVGDHSEALRRQASLTSILAALRDSPHVLYLVCHGRLEAGETMLCLENEANEATWVRGSALVEAIENLSPPPMLAILIACRSAGDGYGEALNALGPQLARAGVPAVLGFQGDVHQRTIRQCMPALWDELRRHGRIDRALSVARHEIGDNLWWQPVLWLRTRDGQLWLDEQPALPAVIPSPARAPSPNPAGLSPQLREINAALWFESGKTSPDWGLVEQIATQLLAANPADEPTRQLLAEAERQLELQARYRLIAQHRAADTSYGDIAVALEELERHWPSFPDPDNLRAWVSDQRRTAKLQPAIELLRERQSTHAALDLIGRFLEDHPGDADAARLAASIAEMAEAPFEQRLRAAQMLGQIGDPRYPTDIAQWQASVLARSYTFGRPEGYWCYLPSGTYRVGGVNDEDGANFVLTAFWIARYPITVAQYRLFIEGGGYHDTRWWRAEGWSARQRDAIPPRPWGWGDPRFSQPSQPVVGVSWDEAVAFCAWLSHSLQPVMPNYQIRLPDESMWEVAARYDLAQQPRSYPWGEEPPDIDRAIHTTRPQQLPGEAPAPVGCCVAGAAACGALDMAGNVGELMASSWESYPHGAAEPGPDSYIVWRGGTWSSSARAMRCTERDRTRRDGHNYSQGGFRVIIAPRT